MTVPGGHRRQRPETDLWIPRPQPGERWDPHIVHTYYMGFSIPEERLGACIYYRYQPSFPLVGGGVGIYQGDTNIRPLDAAHLNWWMTMPWPEVDGRVIRVANGLVLTVVDPGSELRIEYASPDGATRFDLRQSGVTPLTARGSLMPALEGGTDPALSPGGSEQFMHVTGALWLDGKEYAVDCFNVRDRSWCQQRPERPGLRVPPLGWTPIYFGPDLALNAFSMEPADTDPAWAGLYEVPEGGPFHQGEPYLIRDGEVHAVTRVRRNVTARHPDTFQATAQELEVEDDTGKVHRFSGTAVASASLPMWHNVAFVDSVFRWQDESGRVTHNTYQEAWFDTYQRVMAQRRASGHQGGEGDR